MPLVRETTIKYPWYKAGDMKIAHYPISYSAYTVTKPNNDIGWMLLNGAVLSQTVYPALFTIYGSNFNTGAEGAGNFRLPDLTEGKIPLAKGLTNFTTVGSTGGEINHTTTTSEMTNHNHSVGLAWSANLHSHGSSASLSSDDAHSHTIVSALADGSTRTYGGTGSQNAYNGYIASSTDTGNVNHYHTGLFSVNSSVSSVSWASSGVNNAGSGGSHNNMQPYVVIGGWLVLYG